ncbi:hypothetical protein PDIP_85440 [Penicillium digitatum Pd1]|uniref:Chalcone/stilbene synthase C-terminal domain-containing protein n=1 Tax=Penicillium digitatum (strain Pd1 / CECT 20795) TaxID=1170230 RepID=K9FV69_PEND1|nr:hypothetical protein PDIP_85440 [Penicillium digitatum Pd1]EKV04951.1 hypothetical protein PDIP_85440 [Penicillium digitatum Pd1]
MVRAKCVGDFARPVAATSMAKSQGNSHSVKSPSSIPPPLPPPRFLEANFSPKSNAVAPALYITGLGSQYPPYLLGPEDLEKLIARFHDDQTAPPTQPLNGHRDQISDLTVRGYQATLDRAIPQYTKHAIGPMFERLLPSYEEQIKSEPRAGGTMLRSFEICDFDWALHPGGRPILDGVAQILQLSKDQLQVSREIYRTRGNSSSASILVVLDQLRLQSNKEHVIATSFGPGLALELALLRRCSVDE